MYLTFQLATGELVAFSDFRPVNITDKDDIDFESFVYTDEYEAIKNDKTVDHTETLCDIASQLELIISGRFQVDLKAIKTYLQRQSAFKEVKAYKTSSRGKKTWTITYL